MSNVCFAYKENKCTILTVRKCSGESCEFFKTDAEQKASLANANDRIASLDTATQKHIAETYYNGKSPWLMDRDVHDC